MNIFKNRKILNWKFFFLLIVIIYIFCNALSLLSPSRRDVVFGLGVSSKLVKYTGTAQHFSILHPSSWSINETPQGNGNDKEVFAIISNMGFGFGNVFLARKPIPDGNLEEVAKWSEERSKRPYTTDFSVISEEALTANYAGLIRTYTYHEKTLIGEFTNECEDWCFISNSIGYDLSFCAEQRDWSQVENIFLQMIASFSVN